MDKNSPNKFFLDRLEQIKIEIKSAVSNKNWRELAKLYTERVKISELIK